MSLLGGIRDLDVLMEELRQRSMDMPAEQAALVEGLLSGMLVERVRLREQLVIEMPGRIGPGWKKRLDKWVKNKCLTWRTATLLKKEWRGFGGKRRKPWKPFGNIRARTWRTRSSWIRSTGAAFR